MELKVGMYVRTKDKNNIQYIRKIIDLPKDIRYGSIVVDKDIHNVRWVSKKNVLNQSENIIDLIEIGDYVNGLPVIMIYEKGQKYDNSSYVLKEKTLELQNDYHETTPHNYLINNSEIKSVVTREMFESIKYEVE